MNVHGNNQGNDQDRPFRTVLGWTFDGVTFPIHLETKNQIANGATARIFKGEMIANTERLVVAVKVFGDMLGPIEQEILVRELRIAHQVSLRHPLILAFLGCADTGHHTSIVSLYMQNGNMMEYIKSHPGCNKKALILQVAEGVNYLHTEEGLVHGDLKCENVLISDFGEALLADFGLSTFVEKTRFISATMTGIRQKHTPRFAAPELVLEPEAPSKTPESDVYAFGMLVLQAITEQLPWSMHKNDMAVLLQLSSGKQPPQPTSSSGFVLISHPWWEVCKGCWSREPGHRPRMPVVLEVLTERDLEPSRLLEGHDSTVESVAYFPDWRRVVSASSDGSIRIWDTLTGRTVIEPLLCQQGGVNSVAVSPDGRQICSGGGDRSIGRWDAASGAPIGEPMIGHDGDVNSVAFSPDGTRIVSCSDDRTIRLWDATTGTGLGNPLACHTDWVWCVAFSPDGACIASGSRDGTISLWDSTTGADMGVLHYPEMDVYSVCFSPDQIHVVSGCWDGVVRIWDVSTRQLVRSIKAHSEIVISVAVSPSGRYIASGSDDKSIRIWDAQTGDAVGAPLTGHEGWVRSVAFSPDGRSVVSGSDDNTVRIWDLFE